MKRLFLALVTALALVGPANAQTDSVKTVTCLKTKTVSNTCQTIKTTMAPTAHDTAKITNCGTTYANGGQGVKCDTLAIAVNDTVFTPPQPNLVTNPLDTSSNGTTLSIHGTWTEGSDGFGTIDSFVTIAGDNRGTLFRQEDTVGTALNMTWRFPQPSASDTGFGCVQAKRLPNKVSGSACRQWKFVVAGGGPAGGGGPLYPNLPAGLNSIFQFDGNSLPSSYNGSGMVSGVGNVFQYFPGTGTTTAGSGVPVDASTVYDVLYPTNLGPGTTPVGLWMWSNTTYPQMTEYYEADWFKLTGTDFEGPGGSAEWKILGYWAVGLAPGGYDAELYSVAMPVTQTGTTAAGRLISVWSLGIRMQQSASWAVSSNVGSLNFQVGKWYRMEIHTKLETAIGAANGILEVWMTNVTDGGSPVKIMSYNNRPYRNSSSTAGFWKRTMVPVWGGGGPANKTRNDHLQIARAAGWGR